MAAAAAGKPLTPQETWGLSPRHRRCKKKNAHRRDPCGLTSMVVASERGWGWLPLGVDPQLQPGGMWPNEAVAMARCSHSHSGLRPLRHHNRSLPLFKPSQNQVLAPYKRPVSPDQASLRLALTRCHQAGQAQKEQAEHTGPAETDSPRERSAGVREAFHRERGGEPKASSTRRRACTGGQRQSYKRVGYLTRSSGWVSQGQAGTATEPRSSSWMDPRCFLEGKEEAAAARAP